MIGMIRQPIPQGAEIESTIATEPALSIVVESDSKSETILKVETAVAPGIAKVGKQPDWTRISIELAVINLVFIILAAGVWLFLRDEKDEVGLTLIEAAENA
jgi:hypothetical protein